jgi:hypothetical protein
MKSKTLQIVPPLDGQEQMKKDRRRGFITSSIFASQR